MLLDQIKLSSYHCISQLSSCTSNIVHSHSGQHPGILPSPLMGIGILLGTIALPCGYHTLDYFASSLVVTDTYFIFNISISAHHALHLQIVLMFQFLSEYCVCCSFHFFP